MWKLFIIISPEIIWFDNIEEQIINDILDRRYTTVRVGL